MKEEAIITEVRPGTQRSLGEGLDINFLQVSFRVLRRSRYQDHGYKVTLKSPAWLSQLESSAPHNGYLMEHAEFTAELAKDERINEDLKVTVESSSDCVVTWPTMTPSLKRRPPTLLACTLSQAEVVRTSTGLPLVNGI